MVCMHKLEQLYLKLHLRSTITRNLLTSTAGSQSQLRTALTLTACGGCVQVGAGLVFSEHHYTQRGISPEATRW